MQIKLFRLVYQLINDNINFQNSLVTWLIHIILLLDKFRNIRVNCLLGMDVSFRYKYGFI